MKKCLFFLSLIIVLSLFNSCSNEVDVLAPYEENAAVYALLDPNASAQFIKINKVYTNPNSRAIVVAKISDSLFFDTLKPFLIEVSSARAPIPLFRTNILLKDSGNFANSPNNLYSTTQKIFPQFKYRLEFYLPKTNKLVSATAEIPNNPQILLPVRFLTDILPSSPNNKFPVRFNTPIKGKIFDSYLYFNYLEVNKTDTNIKTFKTITWKLIEKYRSENIDIVESVSTSVNNSIFFDLLLKNIAVDNTIERRFLPCTFSLICGNLELDNYIQASEPSIGIVQKQTDYTNVSNGIGLFASRNSISNSVNLSLNTKFFIATNVDYKQLNFKY